MGRPPRPPQADGRGSPLSDPDGGSGRILGSDGAGPRLPAVPARPRRAADGARPAAHLRGPLQGDDRALPRGGDRVRHRLGRRRRPAPDRLRVRGRRGARALRRRAHQPRRARDARLPDRRRARTSCPTRRAPSSSSTTAPRRGDPELQAEAQAAYADLVRQATDREPEPGDRGDVGLPDGRDGRVRARRQAGPARPALGDRAAEAPPAAVPRGGQAAGLHRARRRRGRGPTARCTSSSHRRACSPMRACAAASGTPAATIATKPAACRTASAGVLPSPSPNTPGPPRPRRRWWPPS